MSALPEDRIRIGRLRRRIQRLNRPSPEARFFDDLPGADGGHVPPGYDWDWPPTSLDRTHRVMHRGQPMPPDGGYYVYAQAPPYVYNPYAPYGAQPQFAYQPPPVPPTPYYPPIHVAGMGAPQVGAFQHEVDLSPQAEDKLKRVVKSLGARTVVVVLAFALGIGAGILAEKLLAAYRVKQIEDKAA